jgi:arsenite-transporting ATPase
VGIEALRQLLSASAVQAPPSSAATNIDGPDLPGLKALVDELATGQRGLILVMGKGGVGKTTIAAAVAVGLAQRGHDVHLTTTDPAAHVASAVGGTMPGLAIDRIDPAVETKHYVEKVMATRGRHLDEQERALMREDLKSPCTEEVAVFHAFSRIVAEARSAFVVLDTAPTGHTLLLLDATGAYHRQMTRDLDPRGQARIVTPLMRLQDADYTRVLIVTLPETTPVSEASALQEDLRRAGIEPFAWVINKTLTSSGTRDPLLRRRLAAEARQIARVRAISRKTYTLGWRSKAPVGLEELQSLS